jgi:hypothetical protein
MKSYWVKFEGAKSGCVEAESDYDAKLIANHVTKCQVKSVVILPYPAEPRLSAYAHPVHGMTPSFCCSPEKCAGKTSCPSNYSCTN